MVESLYFIKKLTTAEAETENNNVHEIYIRLTNDFDYESFFKSKAYLNSSNNPEITFKAIDLTYSNIQKEYDLRFVYYKNSNKEKRIPSMRAVFADHGVKAGDIVCLESRTENGETKFYLTFNRNIDFLTSGDFFYYRKTYNTNKQIELYKTLSVEQREKVFAFYVKYLDKSKIGEEQVSKYTHTYIPHINKYVQGVENFNTLYDICSLEDFEKVQKRAAKDKNPDPNYLAAYQASFNKYGRMLTELLSPDCKINLIDFGAKVILPKASAPLQQIFYGAPGTGKSHEVNETCKKHIHFRTTFHPDSDYATFVGCYKPIKAKKKNGALLDYAALVVKLKELVQTPATTITTAAARFGYEYYDSIVYMLNNTNHTVPELLAEAYKSNTTYDSTIRAGMNVYENASGKGSSSNIVYEFVPQSFTKAYIRAWELQEQNTPVYLVIEEINRGNCAQIFGDLFQLLDRDEQGYSKYEISPDTDLQNYISEQGLNISGVLDSDGNDISEEIANGELMKLPNNLFIWATMNTSDQSLFPIDSAFKRRWDWKYMPIDTEKENWKLEVNGKPYSWSSFLKKINKEIQETTSSEDKMLGFYFCKAENGVISEDRFVSKVLFYIYNDVFKDYGLDSREFFKNKEDGDNVITFQSLYKSDGTVNKGLVEKLLNNLDVEEAENVPSGYEDFDGIEEVATSDIKEKQSKFWKRFNEYRVTNKAFTDLYSERKDNGRYMDLSFKGLLYHPVLNALFSRNKVSTCIWIGPSDQKDQIFDSFKQNEIEINMILGETMNFHTSKNSYTLSVTKDVDLSNEANWQSVFDWYMSMAIKMYEIKEKFGK